MIRFIDSQKKWLLAAVVMAGTMVGQTVQADTFPYIVPDGLDVQFIDVSENTTSGEPLFGEPAVVGNTLDFNPVNFKAEATDPGTVQIVDSQLTFTVMTINDVDQILGVRISERGDYALTGLGDAFASANVAAEVFWEVLEINNAPVVGSIGGQGNLVFTPSGGTYNLAEDGTGGDIWNGLLEINLPEGTTKVRFTMDNSLAVAADNGGTAYIAKKDGDVRIEILVPEPASASLGLLGLLGVVMAGRRRWL